jgi:hypothetical protein
MVGYCEQWLRLTLAVAMLYGKCADATEGVEGLFDAMSRLASSEAVQVETRPVLLLTYLVERPATITTMQPTTTPEITTSATLPDQKEIKDVCIV